MKTLLHTFAPFAEAINLNLLGWLVLLVLLFSSVLMSGCNPVAESGKNAGFGAELHSGFSGN